MPRDLHPILCWPRVAAFVLVIAATAGAAPAKTEVPAPVPVDLYVMSRCPWGVKAENVIIPAVKSLRPHVDLRLYFIAQAVAPSDGAAASPRFTSMHGEAEVAENLRQVCAMRQDAAKAQDYILARNQSIDDPNWQAAAQKAGLDAKALERCAQGTEGAALLTENLKAHDTRNAQASPTIDIAGAPYAGPRGLRSITLAICEALKAKGVTPEACTKAASLPPDPEPMAAGCGAGAAPMGAGGCGGAAAGGCGGGGAAGGCGGGCGAAAPRMPNPAMLPSPLVFGIRLIVDGACPLCRPTYTDAFKQLYPSAAVTTVDVESKEGKQLIQQAKLLRLPAYLLERKVEEAANFQAIRNRLEPAGEALYALRPEFALPTVWLERQRRPHHLDVFAQPLAAATPYAEQRLSDFLAHTDRQDLTLSFHVIVQEGAGVPRQEPPAAKDGVRAAGLNELATVSPGPLLSLGGPDELREGLRQACLFQHAPLGDFFKYLACRNADLTNAQRAEQCLARDERVARCIEGGEGEGLLRQDARLVQALGVKSEPVVLWQNRYGPFGIYQVDLDALVSAAK